MTEFYNNLMDFAITSLKWVAHSHPKLFKYSTFLSLGKSFVTFDCFVKAFSHLFSTIQGWSVNRSKDILSSQKYSRPNRVISIRRQSFTEGHVKKGCDIYSVWAKQGYKQQTTHPANFCHPTEPFGSFRLHPFNTTGAAIYLLK